ncbi:hypothetical protein AEAC466_17405 [Asticcacaulis sp. AC466]|uniref:hypothetical protein n=1 Tax=Asticcacaulis sp. AC466 TaxID=1282362 RepID=UPI0003C3D024|nr:hypothetical protein [Asticcacaulis sp. AC466]ESQ82400.1 hypothetical protein AEAC466_17405 [Asticcacaulis sp. AC466]
MPNSIAYVAEAAAAWVMSAALDAGISGSTAILLAQTAYFVTSTALTVAGTAAITVATMPALPSPEAVQTPLKQTRPPVRQGYGRMRVSGPRALWASVPGWAVESNMLHEGRVDGFEQVYLNDQAVTVKSNHYVQSIGDAFAENLIGIWLRPGRSTEIPTPDLVAACGSLWTNAHRNDGIASLDMMVKSVRQQDLSRRYPNGEPLVSVVTRLSPVYDWRDSTQVLTNPATWKWSQNAILCWATWEWYGRYLERASEDNVTPNPQQLAAWAEEIAPALAYWTLAADICDETVMRKDGVSEARYSVALMTLAQDKEDTVRQTFMKACDGWTMRRSDGSRMVRVGQYINPTFEVTDSSLISLNWERGTDASAKVNLLEGAFLSPDNDYTAQPMDPWADEEAIQREGEIRDTFDLAMVPSHSQARRLLKREMYRRRAPRRGTITMDLSGLDVADLGHRWVRVVRSRGPMSMRNIVVEITGEGVVDFTKLSVTFPVRMSGANIDAWTPALEEGFKPNETNRTLPDVLPPPELLDAYASFQSDRAALIVVKVDNPHDDSRTYQLSIIDSTGAATDGPWQEGDVVTGGIELRAGPVGIGDYHVTVRANIAGRLTEWYGPPTAVSVTHAAAPYFPTAYADGTDINELKPAQPGADKTSENTSKDTAAVAGVPAGQVVANIAASADELIFQSVLNQAWRDYQDALNFDSSGESNQTKAINALYKATNALNMVNLIAALTSDGSAMALNSSLVMSDGTTNLATFLSLVKSVFGSDSVTVSQVMQALDAQSGRFALSVSSSNGAVTGIEGGVNGNRATLDFVSGVIRFISTAIGGVAKTPMIISGDKVIFTADVEVDGALLVAGSTNTLQIANNAVTDFLSLDVGFIGNLSTEKTIATLAINPKGGRVRIQWRANVGNPSSTEIALRLKVFRNGTNISGSLGTKLNSNFPTNYIDFVDDLAGYTSSVTYTLTAQTVTGTDIGDTGGSGINRDLNYLNFTVEVKKK